ncbi:hypothetical protein E3O06_12040 [Cryobacterium glaciale]|uniref:Uncharacterized protein n=1 Tax=Cryobacterium glaciale TaxID=1259145 RepID=A0A4R8UTG4_9MICO|nr:DUF6804 family protein [Cryobacterium glaciale]TFB71567.1 hypothetical protein E3O06_12040 [Cryobacterium glaciale]
MSTKSAKRTKRTKRTKKRPSGTPAAPTFARAGLAPGLLGALVLLAGFVLVGGEGFTIIRYAVSILALILCVFVVQAKTWWWLVLLAPIAVLWNPVVVIPLEGGGWLAAQFIAALTFVVVGIRNKVPVRRE